MVDLFFRGFAMMLDAQRNAMTAGQMLVPASNGSLGRTQQGREIGATEQQVIPVTKEELRIGKRQVQSAKAYRVSAKVVEVPVEQPVNLRAETVVIERRPARGTSVRGGQAFQDHTFEVHEMYEEPVVGKVVTQAEEVVIYKTLSERTAIVRETVRETRVDVEERNVAPQQLPRPRAEVQAEVVEAFPEAAGDKPRVHGREQSAAAPRNQVERKDRKDGDNAGSGDTDNRR